MIDGINVANWEPSQKHLYFIQTDRLGVPMNSRDEYGLTNWAAVTIPYGAMAQTVSSGQFTGPVTQNLRLPGQYYDPETADHYNLNRYYNPVPVGRYIEADPLGMAAGRNPYAYANENPLKSIDPKGLWVIAIGRSGSALGSTSNSGIVEPSVPAAQGPAHGRPENRICCLPGKRPNICAPSHYFS